MPTGNRTVTVTITCGSTSGIQGLAAMAQIRGIS
jgi:hypothetical protein